MRRIVALLALAFFLGVSMLGAAVMLPGSQDSSSLNGGMLMALAAANTTEGNGDLLGVCGTGGKAGPGATIAANAARRAGFTGQNLVIAVAVAGAESGWNPLATHLNSDGSTDYGEWQINSVHAALLAAGNWRDPYSNAQMAYSVFQGSGWGAWTTYTSGAYLAKMSAAQAAVNGTQKVAVPASTSCTVPAGKPGTGEYHLTAYMITAKRSVEAQFPGLTVGCYRSIQDGGEHPKGRACDFMVYADKAKGDAIASWIQAHYAALHVLYVIWYQHIWSPARASEGWRLMPDRGSPTQNHQDHVHLSVTCGPNDPAWAKPCGP